MPPLRLPIATIDKVNQCHLETHERVIDKTEHFKFSHSHVSVYSTVMHALIS